MGHKKQTNNIFNDDVFILCISEDQVMPKNCCEQNAKWMSNICVHRYVLHNILNIINVNMY